MTGDSFEEHWPRYPSDASGHKLMDLTAECEVDKLFKLQWDSSSEFLAKSQEVRGNKDFVATPWLASSDEVEAAAKTANSATPDQTIKPAEYEGKLRKTTCNSFGMGMKFQTFEVQRCIEAKEGQKYIMNTCVMTTATYGEKFRPCFKYTLSADGDKKCRLQVEYTLVYVTSVNAFIKKAIERGASNGITKNFETVQEVMGDFITVHQYGKKPAGKPSASSKQAEPADAPKQAAPQRPRGPRHPWWTGVLDRRFVGSFEPLAVFFKRQFGAGGAAVPRDGVSLTATGLALALMVITIYILRSTLHAIHTWMISCTGISGWVFNSLFGWMDVPDSLCEVVLSFCLLVAVHTVLKQLVDFASDMLDVPDHPKPSRGLDHPADDDGPDGTTYDGYEDAYNDASSSMTEEGSSSPSGSRSQRVRHRDVWNQQIKEQNQKTKENIKHGFKEFRRIMADGWKQHQERHEEKKEKKEERKERRRERRHSRNNSNGSVDSVDVDEVQPSASSGSSAVAAAKVRPVPSAPVTSKSLASEVVKAPAPTPSQPQTTSGITPLTAGPAVTDASALGGHGSPKAVKVQQSPPSGTVTSVMTPLLEKTDHVLASWGFSRGNTMQPSKSAEGMSQGEPSASGAELDAEPSGSVTSVVTPILEKTDDYLASWGLTNSASNPGGVSGHSETTVQASARSAPHGSAPSARQVSSLSLPDQPVTITADRHATYSEAELAEAETVAGPIEEEVFENERFQPFKGWGHNWPGHFLPTDKVGHWSHRDGTPGKSASMAFSAVAPKLPKSWQWVEEGWVVDTQGIADDAVDVDGWSYATDFGWLRMPPAPNAGKFRKVRDYVRRRRWIRSRVKKAEKPKESGSATAPASTSSSPVFNRPSGLLADTDGRSQSSFTSTSRPNLNKVSATSSVGTGPIFSRPSGVHDINASFTSQRSAVGAGGLGSPGQGLEGVSRSDLSQADMQGSSSRSLGGLSAQQQAGTEDRPYMNLSEVRHGLSSECGKWGNSVASELQKALSSVGEDSVSLARDSMRSEDYVGNSPMSAGLQRLGGPSTTFHSNGGPSTSAASIPQAGSTSQRFLRESTPQTMGTAGGIPVAPHLAQATGPANMTSVSRFSGPNTAAGLQGIAEGPETASNVAVQNSTAEDFPAAEELSVEGSAPSAPSTVFGQVRHGRLNMDEEPPLAAFPASSVAAGLSGPSVSPEVMHNIDRDLAHTGPGSPAGHHHAYEKSGVVLPRPAGGLTTQSQQ